MANVARIVNGPSLLLERLPLERLPLKRPPLKRPPLDQARIAKKPDALARFDPRDLLAKFDQAVGVDQR
jgi:hypothetical protein